SKSLTLPYEAAAQPLPNDYTVQLCHTRRQVNFDQSNNPQELDLGEQLLPGPLGAPVLYSDTGSPLSPFPQEGARCGTLGLAETAKVGTPAAIGSHFVANVSRNKGTITVPALTDGYHGFWTLLWRSSHNGNDCLNPNDFESDGSTPEFPFEGAQFDQATCSVEEQPASPDAVLGIDNQDPNIYGLTVNGTAITDSTGALNDGDPDTPGIQPVVVNTASADLQVTWTDNDNFVGTPNPNSGVLERRCSPVASTEDPNFECSPGQRVTVTGGDGAKKIRVRIYDAAGNTDFADADVFLDTVVPASNGARVAGTATALANGWFESSPQFDLSGFNDFGGSGPAAPPYEYQFDDGQVHPCSVDVLPLTCRIGDDAGEDLPGIGRHRLRWTAVDKVGNKFTADDNPDTPAVDGRKTLHVKVDGDEPISDLLSVPAAPNGANGWFSGKTWITFGAFDQPGASGFKKAADDASQIGGVDYRIADSTGVTTGTFDISNPSPIRLRPGSSTVCWQAEDQAGNVDVDTLGDPKQCKTFLVDKADPLITLSTTPNSPDGLTGWYKSNPVLDPTVDDGGKLGSGVGTDTLGVCTQKPLIADPAPTGTCISIDGAPFIPVDHNLNNYLLTLGEGLHEVRAFSTDTAGRRSSIVTRLYRVDLSNPVAVARTIMPQPSAGKWWRNVPVVVLRADDGDRHNSGVVTVKYRLDGGPENIYTGPFEVPEGVHRIDYWSVDASGRKQATQTLKVAVDLKPPVPTAKHPDPQVWLRSATTGLPLTSPTAQLHWTVTENLSGIDVPDNTPPDKVNIKVVVYDVMGYPVRKLNGGDFVVRPGETLAGSTEWDGKFGKLTTIVHGDDSGNLASLVPVGTYYFRVVATDAAGNVLMSGESSPLTIKVSLT
ncbi:MAG: hypothetical protein M3275_05520, partial [Thermoproteota archaeon]|nr:hypothetical protein [Thermoproteota archaeon]